jgi:hypothetical protein
MTRRPACLWVAVVGLLSVLAGAVPAAAQGSDEERRACTPDAMRLCREYIPNVDRIIACMVARRAELSPECQAFVKPDEPEPTAVATAPGKPARTARGGAQNRAAKTRKPQNATAAVPVVRQTQTRKTAAPMNLLPSASRPAPAKKAARDKQAQRTQ